MGWGERFIPIYLPFHATILTKRNLTTLRLRYAYVAFAVRIRCACGTHTLRFRYSCVLARALSLRIRCAFVVLALRMRCACDVNFLFVSTIVLRKHILGAEMAITKCPWLGLYLARPYDITYFMTCITGQSPMVRVCVTMSTSDCQQCNRREG